MTDPKDYLTFDDYVTALWGPWRFEYQPEKEGVRLVTRGEFGDATSAWLTEFRVRQAQPQFRTKRLENLAQRRLASAEAREALRETIRKTNQDMWYPTHGFVCSGNDKTIAYVDGIDSKSFMGKGFDDKARSNTRYIATFQPYQATAMLDEIERLRGLLEAAGVDPGKAEKTP